MTDIGRRIDVAARAVRDLDGYESTKGTVLARLELMARFVTSDEATRRKAGSGLIIEAGYAGLPRTLRSELRSIARDYVKEETPR